MELNLKQVNIGPTTEIELPKLDVTKYIGTRAQIESVEECDGEHGYYIKVRTTVLDKAGDNDLRASKIFGLQKSATGQWGWGKDTKLGLFLKKMNVAHYNDLIGKEVVVQTQTGKEGKEYLVF